jgi:hypothetical protein
MPSIATRSHAASPATPSAAAGSERSRARRIAACVACVACVARARARTRLLQDLLREDLLLVVALQHVLELLAGGLGLDDLVLPLHPLAVFALVFILHLLSSQTQRRDAATTKIAGARARGTRRTPEADERKAGG